MRRLPPAREPPLIRAIDTRRLAASIVNATIGAGIFVLPATAAAQLGAAAPAAYVVCAVAMGLVAACFAAAGSRVASTGGPIAAIDGAFGSFAGFIAGVLYWLAAALAVASVSNAFASSVAAVSGVGADGWTRAALIAGVFGALAAVNVRGVRGGIRLVEVMTAAKLLPLLFLIAAGLWFAPPDAADAAGWISAIGDADIGRGAILIMFAFIGLDLALMPSGEVCDPARTVPRAIVAALTAITVIYLLLQIVAARLLGDSLATSPTPLADAAFVASGAAGRSLLLLGSIVSMFGYISGDMLGTPRALLAMGVRGTLPARFARVDPRFVTPVTAIVFHAVVVAVMAVTSTFESLAILTSVASLSLYLMAVFAAYELERRGITAGARPLALPGGFLLVGAAAAVLVWLLAQATPQEFALEAAVLVAASLWYAWRSRSVDLGATSTDGTLPNAPGGGSKLV